MIRILYLVRLPLLVGLFAFATPGWAPTKGLEAQVVERERQELLIPDRGIVEVSRELRERLDLFPEVEGFRVARLLLRADGTAVLEIESVLEGRLVRERRLMAPAELDAFRENLAARFDAIDRRLVLTREGRGGLVLGQTLVGLAYHGWAVPVALDVSSAQGAVAAYLLTAGASFYVPYRLTRDRTVADAHRDMTIYGGTRGIATGLFLGDLFMGDDPTGLDDDRERVRFATGVVAGTGGSFLGFHAVDRWGPSDGTAALWRAMGDAGLGGGAALAYALGPYASEEVTRRVGDDLVLTETRMRNRRLGHAITLAGQGAGLAAGAWLGGRRTYSEGDASALRSAMVLGAQVGATTTRGVGVDDGRGVTAGALAGGVAGIVLGDMLLDRRNLTGGEGLLVNAGHLAGGATALGITYLIVEEIPDRPVLYLTTSTVGSLLGAGLVWRAVTPGRSEAGRPAGPGDGIQVTLHPSALLLGLGGGPAGRGGETALPLLTIRF